MLVLDRTAVSVGAAFRWELDMIDALVQARAAFSELAVGVHSDVRLEVPTAAGVPDVMFLEWDEDAIGQREALGLAPVTDLTRLRVLEILERGRIPVPDLSRAVGVSAAHLGRTVLPALEALGWVERWSDRSVSLPDALTYQAPVRSMVTVEAKLSDWRRAFKQASLHAQTADRAYIALDARRATAASRIADELADEGVGLATVDADSGEVRLIAHPRKLRVRDAWFRFASEQAWELRLQDRHVGDVSHVFGRDLRTLRAAG